MQPVPSQFLVTVDRQCRDIFLVDREHNTCKAIAHIDQQLDRSIERQLLPDSRYWNRSLKTLAPSPDGYVLCDIFGIYDLDCDFHIRRYLSLPEFNDLHSAFPEPDGSVLISNTGCDNILRVDWDGYVYQRIDLHKYFPSTPWMEHDLSIIERDFAGDMRVMPLDWTRESCHANWARETPLGTMVSCFIQGTILFFRNGRPDLSVRARPKLHSPCFVPSRRTIVFAASFENKILEIDLEGKVLWCLEGFSFAKHVDLLGDNTLLVADTGNQRITLVNLEKRQIIWERSIPGPPYVAVPLASGSHSRAHEEQH
jgi:hypothetical protein